MPRSIAFLTVLVLLGACHRDEVHREPPRAHYDPKTGRLDRLAFSSTTRGPNDAVALMDGARVERIELDENGDGKADRREYYQRDGTITRVDVSSARDGRFNRSEFYESAMLARVEEDTDADGRADKWEWYRSELDRATGESAAVVASVAFDDTHRGTPSRRLVFDESGRVSRIEVDPDGDGIFTNQETSRP